MKKQVFLFHFIGESLSAGGVMAPHVEGFLRHHHTVGTKDMHIVKACK